MLKRNWTLGDGQVPWLSHEDVEFEVAYKTLQDTWEVGPRIICAQPGVMAEMATSSAPLSTGCSQTQHQ